MVLIGEVGAPALHALFQRRFDGDDALLELARLRFAQAGLAAEVYGGSVAELAHTLTFVPPDSPAPTVHLARSINLLHEPDREAVVEIVRRFGGELAGLVVHDKPGMPDRLDEFRSAVSAVSNALVATGTARLFVEYAAGFQPAEFVAMGAAVNDVPQVGLCIDTGHVGIRAARRAFARLRPDVETDLAHFEATDPAIPTLVDDVVAAVAEGVPAVVELAGALAAQGTPSHFHLHDGHPLVRGLSDHFGFLGRLPIPFAYEDRRSLPPLFGVPGLAAILAATRSFEPGQASLTLEIHQVEARLPLADAAGLFGHWRDPTNAERMNAWLAVLAEHADLVAALRHQPELVTTGVTR